MGQKLGGNRVVRRFPLDELGQARGQRDRIAGRDLFERGKLIRRDEAGVGERRDCAQRHGSHLSGSASGVHITWSTRSAPTASIASRSKPSAMPEACGIDARAVRKSSSSG